MVEVGRQGEVRYMGGVTKDNKVTTSTRCVGLSILITLHLVCHRMRCPN